VKISKHFIRFNDFSFLYAREYDFALYGLLLEVPKHVKTYLCAANGLFILNLDFTDWGRMLNLKRYDQGFIKGMKRQFPEIVE
jgi:hypothetical protein